jgi:hypothetical protein
MSNRNPVPPLREKQRLQKLSTAEGMIAEEYLLAHPEYKLSQREMQRYGHKVLKLAARRIEELHEHTAGRP